MPKTLKAIKQEKENGKSINRLEVVCPPDQPRGRNRKKGEVWPVPVKEYALANEIPIHQPLDKKTLKGWHPPELFHPSKPFDVGIVVSFRYLIPQRILHEFNISTFNVHPSLLPQYQGPAPIHHTLLNGDARTGISIMQLAPRQYDTGAILKQVPIDVASDETYRQLASRLAQNGAQHAVDVLTHIEQYEAQATPQDEFEKNTGVIRSHAPKVTKDQGLIDWNASARQIYNQWRALGDNVTVFTYMGGKRMILREMVVQDESHSITLPLPLIHVGEAVFDSHTDTLWILCGDGFCVGVKQLQMQQKNAATARAFANGYKLLDGTKTIQFDSNPETNLP